MGTFQSSRYGEVTVEEYFYADGGPALAIIGRDMHYGEVLAKLTVNLPDHANELQEGEFFVKTWFENEQIAKDAMASGLFVDTGKRVETEHVIAQVWRFAEHD